MKNYKEIMLWINHQKTKMIKLTEEWSSINSGSDNIEGLNKMLKLLILPFSTLEGSLTTVPLPPKQVIDSEGNIINSFSGSALLITKRPQAPIQVLLGGHMDTVYPVSSPFQRVTIMDNTTMKGPGVADMKGGLVILLTTLQALEQYKYKDKIGWQVLITPDEEIGSMSSRCLHIECAKKHHFGMIFEPTFSDGAHASSRKGSINFSLISKGKSTHAGRDFHLGKNAIIPLMRVLLKINSLNTVESKTTINIGKIQGGNSANIVPDLAISTCNLRGENLEDLEKSKEAIQNIIDLENDRENSNIGYFLLSEREPKPFDKKQNLLFSLFKESAIELNSPFEWRPTGGVCDGNIWANAGLPTIDTLGPVGSGIHTFEETIHLDSLRVHTQLCASLLMKLAAGELSLPMFK